MTTSSTGRALRRTTGGLFVVGALAFAGAATVLSFTFDRPDILREPADPVLRLATYVGATSVVLALVGFLRWVFVVPPLADSHVSGNAVTRAAVDAAWTAQHQFGGALLGGHLSQLLATAWSIAVSVVIEGAHVIQQTLGPPYAEGTAQFPLLQAGVRAAAEATGARLVSTDCFGPRGGAQSNLGDRICPAALADKTATVLGDPDQPLHLQRPTS